MIEHVRESIHVCDKNVSKAWNSNVSGDYQSRLPANEIASMMNLKIAWMKSKKSFFT